MQTLGGTVTTTPCLAVGAEGASDNMFMLTPSASSQDVIDTGENIFQVCFTDPNQGTASADYIQDEKLGSKIGVIYNSSDAYSSGITNNFLTEAQAIGLEVVANESFTDDNSTDLTTQVQSCKYFGCDGLDGLLTVEGFDTSLAEGVMLLTPFVASSTDEATVNFVKAYGEEANGDIPNQFAADGYDVIKILYKACVEAGVTADMSASEICDALKAVFTSGEFSYDGLTGEQMTWDESGAVSKSPRGMIIQNGEYQPLESGEAQTEAE